MIWIYKETGASTRVGFRSFEAENRVVPTNGLFHRDEDANDRDRKQSDEKEPLPPPVAHRLESE